MYLEDNDTKYKTVYQVTDKDNESKDFTNKQKAIKFAKKTKADFVDKFLVKYYKELDGTWIDDTWDLMDYLPINYNK